MPTNTLVVGYDGSREADQAARWALREAERTGATVEFVHAWVQPPYVPAAALVPDNFWSNAETEAAINAMMARLVVAARRDHPTVEVTSKVTHGPVAQVLRDRSTHADLLVVGGRSHGAVADILLGSVAAAVAVHAACSVVVVRGTDRPADLRPVVVGLDDSPQAESLARFAFEQAAAYGVAVNAIRAWMPPPDPWIGSRFVDRDEISTAERAALLDLLRDWREKFPTVPVATNVVVGHPYRILTDAAWVGQLVVVGARGRGGFHGPRLGSVSRHLLHHSPCSVAVVRDAAAAQSLEWKE